MSERLTVTITIFASESYENNWPSENLIEFKKWVDALIEQVPAEYRPTASIGIGSVSSYEDSHYGEIEVSYQRPETDEEMQMRHAREQSRAAEQEAKERRALDVLIAKYGKPVTR
jgi:hypothetical protein